LSAQWAQLEFAMLRVYILSSLEVEVVLKCKAGVPCSLVIFRHSTQGLATPICLHTEP